MPTQLEVQLGSMRPSPYLIEPYVVAHRFTFTASPFPSNAIGTLTFTFRPGVDFLWTSIGLMGSNPSAAAADVLRDMFISFYVGLSRRPLQSEPINGATFRGSGADAVARRSFGLPMPIKESLIRSDEPVRIDVDNKRAPAAGQTVSYDVSLHGLRRYRELAA